jgi:hypothetical protein
MSCFEILTGIPNLFAASTAAVSDSSNSIPGTTGTSAATARSLARYFLSHLSHRLGVGPTNTIPLFTSFCEKGASSLRKPYPGMMASTPDLLQILRISSLIFISLQFPTDFDVNSLV